MSRWQQHLISTFPAPGVIGVLVGAFVVCSATVAGADVSEEDQQRFEQYLQQGSQHLNDEQYEGAIEQLDRAREILDHPRISLNIADAHLALNQCSDAREEYGALADREDLDEQLAGELQEGLERLEECVEMGRLEILCEPEDATVHISGGSVDDSFDCPYREDIPSGEFALEVTAGDYQPDEREVTVQPGSELQMEVSLEPVPSPDPPQQDPEPEQQPDEQQLSEPDPPVVWPTVVGYTAIGAGVATLTIGGIVDYQAAGRADELAEARADEDFERIDELEAEGDTNRTTAAVLYGTGLGLVAGGVALQFVDLGGAGDESHSLRIGPSVGGMTAVFQW